jgi:hypothetical protein
MRDQSWRGPLITGRVCSGLEVEPKYCDVIIQRWQELSGRHATLEGDGRTFEQIKTASLEVAHESGVATGKSRTTRARFLWQAIPAVEGLCLARCDWRTELHIL